MNYFINKYLDKLYITQVGKSVGTGIILHADSLSTEFLESLADFCQEELKKRNK